MIGTRIIGHRTSIKCIAFARSLSVILLSITERYSFTNQFTTIYVVSNSQYLVIHANVNSMSRSNINAHNNT